MACCFPVTFDRSRKGSFKFGKSSSDKFSRSSDGGGSSRSPKSRSFSLGRKIEKKEGLVVCFGELLIDFVPTVSGISLAEAPGFQKAPGGAPANVAVAIARLGGSSAFIGKVGDDEFGRMLADILKQNKVENCGMRFDANARTALAFVTLRGDGEREFMFFRHPSADMLLTEEELDKDLINKTPTLAFEQAARQGIMSIWNQADVIKISEEEITFLTGGDDPYDDNVVLEKLYHKNLKLLIVTEGADGCRYYTKAFHGKVHGIKVQQVDTTGAGDAFDEEKLRGALLFANGCGAITVTQRGAIPSLPTKSAVVKLLEGANP
ncbi:hypothetical protein DH2020_046846 [Rehmannia glutinosa]|uniref:fructokinase n=1 Tax=Rehmannia glutinosa TaxID=99300 RepID=A0ABR0UAT5_REHGL